uniref:Uncharacterized protein n=1 Tax=Ditylum brightwellii TaxID=49249 RepID=A0A6V2QF14_9STRA|mmetsp:Transcript_20216/g.29696  ORF Transcript_20216/g.29696 Transcript_20216/m.29696 type:complete len:112 (+) Transcript_20216:2164-2499(+)
MVWDQGKELVSVACPTLNSRAFFVFTVMESDKGTHPVVQQSFKHAQETRYKTSSSRLIQRKTKTASCLLAGIIRYGQSNTINIKYHHYQRFVKKKIVQNDKTIQDCALPGS